MYVFVWVYIYIFLYLLVKLEKYNIYAYYTDMLQPITSNIRTTSQWKLKVVANVSGVMFCLFHHGERRERWPCRWVVQWLRY